MGVQVNKLTGDIISIGASTNVTPQALPRLGSLSHRRVVGFGSKVPHVNNTKSDGVETIETSRFRYEAIGDISDISVVFMNGGFAGYTLAWDNITITASVEYPAGTFTQLNFNGNTSYLLKWGRTVTSDEIPLEIPKGSSFWVRTCVTVASGEIWIKGHLCSSGQNEGVAAGIDATMSGTIANGTAYAFVPSAIIGTTNSRKMSVLQLGDSLSTGQGDSGFTSYKFQIGGGIFGRAFTNQFSNLITNVPGDGLGRWTPENRPQFASLLSVCNVFICQLGINGISDVTSAVSQERYVKLWDALLSRGIKGYQTTITPWTDSTDSWATAENQTVKAAVEPNRLDINNWIRDGAPIDIDTRAVQAVGATGSSVIRAGHSGHPLLGYFDLADIAESARNSGLWKAGYTPDGIHANSTGYEALAQGIDTTKFYLY